jgi:hypothetical protein
VLRRVENVSVRFQRALFGTRGWLTLTINKQLYRVAKVTAAQFDTMCDGQKHTPVTVGRVGERTYWWYRDRFYSDNDQRSQGDIHALLVTRNQREE